MTRPLDLTAFTLLTGDNERTNLSGMHDADQLTKLFVDNWVPYLECHKCRRHDYCKFTKESPHAARRAAGRLADIQCGVVVTMIEHYTAGTFPLLETLTTEELQNYLDASYHLVQFVYEAELKIGRAINPYFIQWLGEPAYRAEFFGYTSRLRTHLDRFAGAARNISFLKTKTTVILTEGPSEKIFLESLRSSRLVGFTDLDVQSYYGSGNRGNRKLEMLARKLHQQGYDLFIQGDCDGEARDIFSHLIGEGIVTRENTFAFSIDFESAFAPENLHDVLIRMEYLQDIDPQTFVADASGRAPSTPFLTWLSSKYGIEVNKIELAENLAIELSVGFPGLMALWDPSTPLGSSEIGQFLGKIQRLP